jgi:predicted neutral ceramidase superfamily lipid hydrolase
LRGFSDAHPQVAYVSTFALLMVPGILLSHWFLGEYFPGAALVPVAFVLSVSLYGVLAIPMLVLHASLGTYLWIIGMVVFAFLGLAIFRAFLGKTPEICEGKESA